MTAMSLNERAMLASLNISVWSARKRDKKITEKVAKDHGTSIKAGNYNKRLLPMEAPSYDAVRTAAGKLRTYHYEATLPWAQDGARILTSAMYFDYIERVRALEAEYNAAVATFLNDYPRLRDNARAVLNGMFSEEDYPSETKLRWKFSVKRDVFPMPSANDFRVALGDVHVEYIRQDIERSVAEATVTAMRDLFQRVHDAVAHVAERLSGVDNVFRDSLISNVKDIVELLPKLNLTNDPRLVEIGKRLSGYLCTLEPSALRDNKKERTAAAAEADEIMRKMAAFMES